MTERVLRLTVLNCEATAAGACRQVELARLPAVIGRGGDCDLSLGDSSVALRHLELGLEDDGPTARLCAGARARVNGRSLPPGVSVALRAGDGIDLGVYHLCVQAWSEGPAGAPPSDPAGIARGLAVAWLAAEADPASLRLVVENGPAAGRVLRLAGDRSFCLGRGADCDLTLDDGQVSRLHARLYRQDGGLWIQDAGSQNGVAVNGRPIAGPRTLTEGDRLRLGRVRLTLRGAAAPAASFTRMFALPAQAGRLSGALMWWCLALALAAAAAAVFS